jgi:3-oxoacyl-[acyl-carrier protein] reductase
MGGRVALVTGAGSPTGIGFAAARLLGERGAAVAVVSTTERIHDRAAELAGSGANAAGYVADLRDLAQATRLAESVSERFGRIDILVNNAGMVAIGGEQTAKRFVELDEASWDADIATTLRTAFAMTRAVLPGMVSRGYGRIVMVSSVTGPLVTNVESAGYGAAKAGMDGLMRGVALEAARHGVTVNSVAPGWIETGSSLPEELVAGRHTPVGRPGRPEEVAEAIAFLASEEAGYVTGQVLVVDGGNTIQEYKGPPGDWY